MKTTNCCPTYFSFWYTPLLGWLMGSFIGALLIGKVRSWWVPNSIPFICQPFPLARLNLAFPLPLPILHFLCRIWAQEESHCLPYGDAVGALQSKSDSYICNLGKWEFQQNYMKNLRNIFRRGFQTWRLPWRRVNMTLLQFFQFSTRYSFVHWQVSVSEDSVPNNLIIFFFSGWPAQLWSADSWSVKHQPANQPNPGHTECHSWYLCYRQSLNHAMSSKP